MTHLHPSGFTKTIFTTSVPCLAQGGNVQWPLSDSHSFLCLWRRENLLHRQWAGLCQQWHLEAGFVPHLCVWQRHRYLWGSAVWGCGELWECDHPWGGVLSRVSTIFQCQQENRWVYNVKTKSDWQQVCEKKTVIYFLQFSIHQNVICWYYYLFKAWGTFKKRQDPSLNIPQP